MGLGGKVIYYVSYLIKFYVFNLLELLSLRL